MFDLKRLLHKKADHPMANLHEARKALAELPVNDAFKALEEISFWIESMREAEIESLAERAAVIKLLDETAQPFQRNLVRDYLAATRMNKAQESRYWMTLFEFWKRLATGYFICIDGADKGGKGAEQVRQDLPLLTVRAMHALAGQIKLMHLRYRPIEERTWSDVIKLYNLAEGKLFMRSLVAAYPSSETATNAQQALLKILMLEAAAPDRLVPPQIELAERLVNQFASSFVLAEQPTGCAYLFDLAARKPPARLLPGVHTHSMMRFFGAGSVLPKLEDTMRQVKLSAVPQDLAVDEASHKDELLDLLTQLLQAWSATPPQRKHTRKTVVSRLNVVHGIAEIRRRIVGMDSKVAIHSVENKDMLYQERLDLRLYGFVTEKTQQMLAEAAVRAAAAVPEEGETESWVMENISACGFGAVIAEVTEDWVKVGSLLGLRPEAGSQWSVGVVRRLSRTPQMQIYVGVQTLAQEPVSVRLRPIGFKVSVWEKVAEVEVHDFITALLLPKATHCVEETCLLLEPGTFAANKEFELMMHGEKSRIRLNALLEQGSDFERASFILVEPRKS